MMHLHADANTATRPKRPRPKVLPAHERETNAQILRRMTIPTDFLRNPRYVPRDEGKCPFRITPASVIFEGYELGSVYEMKIEFLNCEGLGRRLRFFLVFEQGNELNSVACCFCLCLLLF